MSNAYLTFFDMAISGVPVLLFCAWQYVSVSREIAQDRARKAAESAERAGHAVGEHRQDHG